MIKLKTEQIRSIVDDLTSGKITFEPPSVVGFNIVKLLDEVVTRLERAERKPLNNDWIDEWGSCKICGGEIPLGHAPDCAYYALETVLKDTAESHRELTNKLFKSLDNEADSIRRESDTVGELTKSLATQRQMTKLLNQRYERIQKLERQLKLHKRTNDHSTNHADEMSYLVAERDDEIVCLKDVIDNMETDLDTAITEVLKLRKQLPDGMEESTIIFKSCPVGHGRLAAENWEDNGCKQCALVEAHKLLGKHVYNA